MKNPPKTKIELINLEESDEDPIDLVMKCLDESSDSEDYDEDYGEGIQGEFRCSLKLVK